MTNSLLVKRRSITWLMILQLRNSPSVKGRSEDVLLLRAEALSPKGQTKFDSDVAMICNLCVEKLNDPAAANGSDEMVAPIDEDLSSHPASLLKTARSSAPVLHEAHGPKRKRAEVPTTVYDSVKPTRKRKKNVRLKDL